MSANGDSEESSNFCAPIIAIGREEVVLDNENSKSTSEGKKSHGFHLVRSKWDPYPWIDSVEGGSSADVSGLRSGDCLLEIDGRDVLGLEMRDIAHLIGRSDRVNLSIWRRPSKGSIVQPADEDFINLNGNSSSDSPISDSTDRGGSVLEGPLPEVSRRLVRAVSGVVRALECPVCLESAAPPVSQCVHGHLLCFGCRLKSSRCPVCRVRLGQGRCLLADKTHRALSEALVRPTPPPSSPSSTFERDDPSKPSRSLYSSIFGSPAQLHSSPKLHHQDKNEKNQHKRNKERSPMRQFLQRLVHSSSSGRSSLAGRSSRRCANGDDRSASTESLPTASTSDWSDHRELLNRSSGSNASLKASKNRDGEEDDETGCPMDGNLLYGRRWLLRLYDRRKSASTGELHRNGSRGDERDEGDRVAAERLDAGGDGEDRRRRRGRIEIEDRASSCLLSVPQTPTWGGSTESMMSGRLCCPLKYTAGCKETVSFDTLMEHLREVHVGPIIYFYKSQIILPFPFPFEKEAAYVMCPNEDIFILQCHHNNISMCSPKAESEIQWKWSVEEASTSSDRIQAKKEIASLQEPFELLSHHVVTLPDCYTGLLCISLVDLNSLEGCIDI